MSAPRVRAVVLDFGGVLWNMRWEVAHQLEAAHGIPRNSLVETLYRTPTWATIERGNGDRAAWLEEAHRLLEARAGRPLPRLHERWRASQHVIPESVDLVRDLRKSYRTAILSNADRSLRARLTEELRIADLFDTIVCSAEVGVAKPDPAAYELAATRLALPPNACLFVDDTERNVDAARRVGMEAVVFRGDRGDDLAALLAGYGVR